MRIVHVTLHKGCANDFESMIHQLGIQIELKTFFLHELEGRPTEIYALNKPEIIDWIWNRCKDTFFQADQIVTSDTAPLARVLYLHRNEIKAKVIVWVCNRVDYISPPAPSPFYKAYAQELREMSQIFSYYAQTPYEIVQANRYQVNWKGTLRPMGVLPSANFASQATRSSVFIGSYHNDAIAINLREIVKPFVEQAGLTIAEPTRYSSPVDLSLYQAVIHIPYAASNLALFEAISHGIPQLLPTVSFLQRLAQKKVPGIPYKDNFFLPGPLEDVQQIEWYQPEFQSCFMQFDSWRDIPFLLNSIILTQHRSKLQSFATSHKESTLHQWKQIFA